MKTHSESRKVPYSAQQMFAMVAAIDRYPEFIPWITGARIRSRAPLGAGEELVADLVISFKVFRERYASRVKASPPQGEAAGRIDVENIDGPFKRLVTRYEFHDAQGGGSEMRFSVEFAFSNAILQRVAGLAFEEAMRRIVRAFEARAAALYGAA